MTKRFTIALVALVLLVLATVTPVSAANGVWPPASWDAGRAFFVVAPYINQGATVFIGEQNLDISWAISQAQLDRDSTSTVIGWWGYDADIDTTSATRLIETADIEHDFWITQDEFEGFEGNWYLVGTNGFAESDAVINVQHPTISVTIRNPALLEGADVTGKSVPTGTPLQFRVGTNMYTVANNANLRSDEPYPDASLYDDPTDDGYLDIVVKTESGSILSALYTEIEGGEMKSIKGQNVNTQPWTWDPQGDSWETGAIVPATNQRAYPAGTYVVYAVSKLNNMQSNYLSGGAAYTGRTVTETRTITLVSDTVKITANKDSVVRTNDFSVTITGRPGEFYNVWVKNTHGMDLGAVNNAPPIVTKGQDRIVVGDCTPRGTFPWSTHEYEYQNGGGKEVSDNAFGTNDNCDLTGEFSYASVRLNTAGTWTVGFTTTANTKAQKYTIRVEQNFGEDCEVDAEPVCHPNDFKGDEVDVKVEKGAVTIVAAGDQSYYLGEEIKLSGTNTESDITYLFIVGPNLPENGGALDFPFHHAICTPNEEDNGICDEAGDWNSVYADVLADNTWSYKWGTAGVDLDAGTYTIYGVSQPCDNDRDGCLPNAAFGTVSIIIKKPFVSATASQSTVAKGDRLYITGTAEGQPASVAIWILGKNFAARVFEPVNSDSTFKYELQQATTANLYAGQYFVVVQHPMQNGVFDIDTDIDNPQNEGSVYVYDLAFDAATRNDELCDMGNDECYSIFKLVGQGALQGSDAAEALVQGINQPYIDDTYTKLQFLVEQPIITVIPVGDKHVGDKFTITASTNLAVDDEVLVEVYSSSFKPTQKSQSGEFSGATGTVKVTKSDLGMNKITFDVDAATFKPDEYIITMNAVIQEATGTALFNVLEAAPPTPAPTVVIVVVPTAATPVPTTVPPTPVPTPTKSPGYGALIALIGLGAVAFIVVRRH